MEDLIAFEKKCNTTEYKVIRITSCYLDPKTIAKAIAHLKTSIRSEEVGIGNVTQSEIMILLINQAQKGIQY